MNTWWQSKSRRSHVCSFATVSKLACCSTKATLATEMKQVAKVICKSCFISGERVALGAACNCIQKMPMALHIKAADSLQATLAALMCMPQKHFASRLKSLPNNGLPHVRRHAPSDSYPIKQLCHHHLNNQCAATLRKPIAANIYVAETNHAIRFIGSKAARTPPLVTLAESDGTRWVAWTEVAAFSHNFPSLHCVSPLIGQRPRQ